MAYKVNPDVCINCGACESSCPVAAISEVLMLLNALNAVLAPAPAR